MALSGLTKTGGVFVDTAAKVKWKLDGPFQAAMVRPGGELYPSLHRGDRFICFRGTNSDTWIEGADGLENASAKGIQMEDLEHTLRCCLYALVADLITADRTIENAEVGVAGNLCEQVWPDLAARLSAPDEGSLNLSEDARRFFADKGDCDIRDFCTEQQNCPDAATVIEILSKILDREGKLLVMDLLHSVAKADANIARQESTLLTKIAQGLE